ncbi:MAG: carbohydrate ABC transporter permease [Candidatus Rokuibacteriota bacterium]
MTRTRWQRVVVQGVLAGFAIFAVTPLLWMVLTSVRPERLAKQSPLGLMAGETTLDNYRRVSQETRVPRYVVNSFGVSWATAAVVVAVAAPAGYSLSRFRFRGSRVVLMAGLAAVMLSGMTTVVPLYLMFRWLGLLNNLAGLVLINAVEALPLSLWIMKAYVDAIPRQLDEMVQLDGGTPLTVFVRVILPVAMPALTAMGLYGFIVSWREFLLAATFVTRDTLKTLPVGILGFFTEFGIEWGRLSATTVVATVPALAVFWVLQRWLTPDVMAGAVKQ